MINFDKIKDRSRLLRLAYIQDKPMRECVKQALEENITLEQISAIGAIFDADLEDLTNYVMGEIFK